MLAAENRFIVSFSFVSRFWFVIEAVLLFVIVVVHWFPDGARANSVILFIPLFAGRLWFRRRFSYRTLLDGWLIAFILLCILNVYLAPYTWGLYVVGRAVMGAGIVWVLVGWSDTPLGTRGLLLGVTIFALLLGIIGVFTSQYTIKSAELQPLIDLIPTQYDLPGLTGGFNVNEIGGIMGAFAVFALALAVGSGKKSGENRDLLERGTRFLAGTAFVVLLFALFLGQSRMALIGVIVGLGAVIVLLIPAGRRRTIALLALAVFIALELAVALNIFVPRELTNEAADRDAGSTLARLDIYAAGLAVLRDHPLTGVGINQFRSRAVREIYPVRGYERQVLPHAHNMLIQTGDDLGIPGILVYVGLNGALALMLVRVWRRGASLDRTAAVAVGAGIAAHLIFGLADAITLFDRFIFGYWLLVGVGAGVCARLLRRGED